MRDAAWHKRNLAKTVKRRKATAARRVGKTADPERAAKRKHLRDVYELGVEYSPSKARKKSPERRLKTKEVARRQTSARDGDTYRGKRMNRLRSTRAQVLKAERLRRGETRAQADKRRREAARA